MTDDAKKKALTYLLLAFALSSVFYYLPVSLFLLATVGFLINIVYALGEELGCGAPRSRTRKGDELRGDGGGQRRRLGSLSLSASRRSSTL